MQNNYKKKQNGKGKNNRKTNDPIVDGKVISLNKYQTQKVIFFKDIVPPRIFTRLKFICNRRLLNAGFTIASIQFRANGLFDFDPAVASNQVAGFDEFAYIWGRYRVYAVKAKVGFSSLDLAGFIANVGFESEVYAANSKDMTNYDGPNQRTKILSGTSGTPQYITLKRNALAVVGDNIVYTEFTYTGTSASNPASLWYTSIAVSSETTGIVQAAGCAVRAEYEIDVEFFERLDDDSSLALQQRKAVNERIENRLKAEQLRLLTKRFV